MGQRHNRSTLGGLLAIIRPGRLLVWELSSAQLAEFTRAAAGMASPTLKKETGALLNGNAVDRGALEAGHEPTHPYEIMGGREPMNPSWERRSQGFTRQARDACYRGSQSFIIFELSNENLAMHRETNSHVLIFYPLHYT